MTEFDVHVDHGYVKIDTHFPDGLIMLMSGGVSFDQVRDLREHATLFDTKDDLSVLGPFAQGPTTMTVSVVGHVDGVCVVVKQYEKEVTLNPIPYDVFDRLEEAYKSTRTVVWV